MRVHFKLVRVIISVFNTSKFITSGFEIAPEASEIKLSW